MSNNQSHSAASKLVHLLNLFLDRVFIIDWLAIFLIQRARRRRILQYKAKLNIHPTVVLGDVILDKNVSIGQGTYMNSGQVFAGEKSHVKIGKFCAIGYNVHIKARTHDPTQPTRESLHGMHLRLEEDIVIGDHVWIGDNVFIRHGIVIGDHAIIGANSVVTKNVSAYTVVGGVPARIIKQLPKQDIDPL
jgi:maltose O-acetyltransferase